MARIQSAVNEEPNDSFTSMIDIVFLLLIFFILQPFKQPEMKLRSELPKGEGPSPTPPDTPRPHIIVRITRDAVNLDEALYTVDGAVIGHSSTMPQARLGDVILARSAGDRKAPVAVMPELHVNFKHVLRVLDECHRIRMEQVKFDGPPLAGYAPGRAELAR